MLTLQMKLTQVLKFKWPSPARQEERERGVIMQRKSDIQVKDDLGIVPEQI